MSETKFRCFRCGYENGDLHAFKKHMERRRECKPKESDITIAEVKKQYQQYLDKNETTKEDDSNINNGAMSSITNSIGDAEVTKRSETPEKKRKLRKLRIFGNENLDYFSKSDIIGYVNDPLKGIQEIIKSIYFHKDHTENHTVRMIEGDGTFVEIHTEDGWTRARTKRVFTKLVYRAGDILEYNVPKKHWTNEFKNFIESMGEFDNEELLALIIEEVGDTVLNCMKDLVELETSTT